MSDFKAKMHHIRSRLRLRPDPAGGTNSAPPEPLAGFKGPTCKGLVAAAYCQVYGVIHFTSPAGCTPGSAPGPTFGNEYGKTLPLPFLLLRGRRVGERKGLRGREVERRGST